MVALENFDKFTGNTCDGVLFLVQLQVLLCNFTKNRPHTRFFTVNFLQNFCTKYLRATASVIHWINSVFVTAQKMKFSIKDFFSKGDQIRWKLQIWSHLLKRSLMENFIFCWVFVLLFWTFLAYPNFVPLISFYDFFSVIMLKKTLRVVFSKFVEKSCVIQY